ncbi:hypothetical protein P5673_030023 [Acropora cervicornis]|uniref:SWIM-type domain-containing protein n=1 Tax=Acropora cervicornis TaxID=6130 RepID=A0AAD9UTU8_ACRCE|nr:hypothetical protein P5673_030023 [Acropora cervicornis]
MQQEVVFLCGPPFSGKELYYAQHFSQTHQRIRPQELFQADPFLGLRAVTLKVANLLNKGHSVVIDDGNSNKKTRKSYFNILKNKVPNLYFTAVLSLSCFICHIDWVILWCNGISDTPDEEEGFNEIIQVEVQLICDTPFKFVVPALFLQWESLFQDKEEGRSHLHNAAIAAINKWSHSGKCACVDEMKEVVKELATKGSVPVFFVHVCAFPWNFERPPNPGLFAWLQRLHTIDLSHRATFFVWSHDSYHNAAMAAGIKCIKASKLFKSPEMINSVLCGLTSQLPLYVKNARLIWSGSLHRLAACVPLFHRVASFHDSTNARDVMVTNNQFYHGVYFKDLETFQSYNSRYQEVAIPTEPASKDLFKKKSCQVPSEQDTCTKEGTPLNIDINTYKLEAAKISPDKQSVDKTMVQPSTSGVNRRIDFVTSLTREDIQSVAQSAGRFRRGGACAKLIRSVSTSVEQDGMLFSGKCQLYDVSALLSDKGIVHASCSCPDIASQLGKCKHAIGLLLWCKNENNVKDMNDISSLTDKGNIRHWKEGATNVKSGSDASRGRRRAGDHIPPSKLCNKRVKTKTNADTTLYCLSPEELLQTAKEIVEEYNYSLGNSVSSTADPGKEYLRSDNQQREKVNTTGAKQPFQGNSSRENLSLMEEIPPQARSPGATLPGNSNVPSTLPDALSCASVELHPNELNDRSLQADQKRFKECQQELAISILDHFI